MGYKYEVSSYVAIPASCDPVHGAKYKYVTVYHGSWLIVAIFYMIREKIRGAGCVQLEWR